MASQWLQKLRSFSNQSRLRTALVGFSGTVLATSAIVAGVVVVLRQLGTWQSYELGAYDTFLRSRPSPGLDDRLLVVGISEVDIQTRNEYPIKDGTLAEVLQKLEANQPLAIGIDIARDFPYEPGHAAFMQQLQTSDRIIASCVLSSFEEPGVAPPPDMPPERVAFADFSRDPDGIVRRSTLIAAPAPSQVPIIKPSICSDTQSDNNQLVSLSLSLALRYLDARGVLQEPNPDQNLQLGSTVFTPLNAQSGGYQTIDPGDYQVMLNYRKPTDIRQVSLLDVLQGRVDPGWVRDRIVLIGYTSQIAKDSFLTPFSANSVGIQSMPGVMIHAQAVSQILSAVLDRRPLIWYWPAVVEILWIWGWAILGGAIAWTIRKTLLFLLLEGVGLVGLVALCYLLFLQGGWIPVIPPAIALVTSAIGVILVDRAHKGGYTQAVYEQVREQVQVILKPKIEIDEEKRAKQVAEITESGYFQDLVQRAKVIREQRAASQKNEIS
ncbi:MAG TPA: CHASE2 domain-containing protein [Crinalium sp.]